MAAFHAFCLVAVVSLLNSFPVTEPSKLPCPRFLSFQLHLQPPSPLNLHNATSATQPLAPHLFSDQPLFTSMIKSPLRHEEGAQEEIVGSARGLYLADAAASMEVRYLFFTATLQRSEGGRMASEGEGSLVLMGSLGSGAISVVRGTRAFAFASGQAKVSIAAAGSDHVISFDVELRYEQQEQESEDAISLV